MTRTRPADDGVVARIEQLANEMRGIVKQMRENDDNHLEKHSRLMARFAERHQRIDTLAKRVLGAHEPQSSPEAVGE